MAMKFEDLLATQRPGYSLDQGFYLDGDIFQVDIRQVLSKQWQYVDHVASLPEPGSYITYNFANESVIIVRTKTDEIKAHFNVCRHRGSRICAQPKGKSANLVCPYHAWVYDLDGSLKVARQMPEEFDKAEHGLHPCQVKVLEGLIFINLDPEDASDFEQLADNVRSFLKPHGTETAQVAHSQKYSVDANWKLVIENFRECYHCTPSHPEYTSVNEYVRVGDKELGAYKFTVDSWIEQNTDLEREQGFKNFPYALQPHHAWRMPIRKGFKTASKDGDAVAPLMGQFKEYDGAETGIFFGALSYFYLNNDYLTAFRITPVSPTHTEVTVTWFVDESAIEGKDFYIDSLKWLWDTTTQQDAKIVNENQIGVNSSRYTPGPYSPREYGTADFTAWYIARLQGKQDERIIFRE